MTAGRWDRLYDLKSRPLEDWVLDEVAAQLAPAAELFPPAIEEWEREDVRARFAPLFARPPGAAPATSVRLALALLRLELARDVEEIDRLMTGGAADAVAAPGVEREIAVFLWQFWLDQLLAFLEFAQGRFRRAQLARVVDALESRLLGHRLHVPRVTLQ